MARSTLGHETGFTLIELMIVIAIIGILAAIAIPQFSAYRNRSFNSAAISDIRNAATAQEAYHQTHETYTGILSSLTGETYGLYLSEGVRIMLVSATAKSYTMKAYHTAGNRTFTLAGPWGKMSP